MDYNTASEILQGIMEDNYLVYTFNGESHTAAEWARIKGVPYKVFMNRIYRGATFENALLTPYKSIGKKKIPVPEKPTRLGQLF